jgi:hypothetical protein
VVQAGIALLAFGNLFGTVEEGGLYEEATRTFNAAAGFGAGPGC